VEKGKGKITLITDSKTAAAREGRGRERIRCKGPLRLREFGGALRATRPGKKKKRKETSREEGRREKKIFLKEGSTTYTSKGISLSTVTEGKGKLTVQAGTERIFRVVES